MGLQRWEPLQEAPQDALFINLSYANHIFCSSQLNEGQAEAWNFILPFMENMLKG